MTVIITTEYGEPC